MVEVMPMTETECITVVRSKRIRCETHDVECRREQAPTAQHPYREGLFCPISGELIGYAEGLPHEA
jgi:hypothetical protein